MTDDAALGQPGHTSHSALGGFYAAIAEQFTEFATVQVDGREVPNPSEQHLESSITQLVIGRSITPRFALQVNVPLIYRSFERPEGFAVDSGSESGLGDVSLLLKSVLVHYAAGGRRGVEFPDGKSPVMVAHEPDFAASVVLLTGLKFPTGATSRLKEEFNEIETDGAPESGIHGHDLTLGTGSYDALIGGQSSLRYRNWFFQADAQFMLRGDGAHQYHFANDFSWSGGPGCYAIRRSNLIAGVQLVASGEYKDVDRFRGDRAEDTGIRSVFLGPRLLASVGRFSAEFGADLPVSIDNTALQVVPDYRIRGSVSVRF